MKTMALTLVLVVCACGFALVALQRPQPASATAARVDLRDEIADVRAEAWRLQLLMGLPRTPSRGVGRAASASYQRWVLRLWTRRVRQLRLRAQHPPHARAFLCIHRYEGPWTAATGNGYYGGLQMDLAFQRHYGAQLLRRKGTADRWTPLEQIWAAEKALRAGRGYWPWPNSARLCGLI